jgi:hypothetical protein
VLSSCLADGPHGHLHDNKGARADRHSPQQSRSQTLPEAHRTILLPSLRESIAHTLITLVFAEAIGLHSRLDNVEGVRGEPKHLSRQTTIERNFPSRYILPDDVIALRILVHQVLESEEPEPVCLSFSQQGDRCAAVQTTRNTRRSGELGYAVERARVEFSSAVRLGLKTDANVLDRRRENCVGQTSERSGSVVLAVTQGFRLAVELGDGLVEFGSVLGLEGTLGVVEGTELNRNTGTNSNEGSEGALVEG